MIKLKVETIRTNNPEEIEYAKTHAEIFETSSGGYEFAFPTILNRKLKRFLGKEFEMDVTGDDNTLNVILTRNKEQK
jgi:hypothetical protein